MNSHNILITTTVQSGNTKLHDIMKSSFTVIIYQIIDLVC